MDGREFVNAVKEVVSDSAFAGVISCASDPPGRRVSPEDKARAEWLRSLGADERRMLDSILKEGIDLAVFGLFCVIDGVRAVEDGPDQGDFELRYIKNGVSVVLNGEDTPDLHDLYNS